VGSTPPSPTSSDLQTLSFRVELAWSEWRHPPASELSLLASEAVFNLRAALDYAVYELAWLDSGQRQEDTQFPIVDDVKDWSKQESRRLPGVSDEHRSAIREYQPFEGCAWMARLRRLSNFDKHRLLVAVIPVLTGGFKLSSLPFAPDPGDASKLRAPMTNPQMDAVLPTNEPAIETLRAIGIGVGRVVERFGPDFGEDVKLSLSQ
jgi:hypothetical protein